ncbi:MAG TPA: hypothetical protein VIU63_06410 [Nitrospira sp.]|jgi:hypothetical protein
MRIESSVAVRQRESIVHPPVSLGPLNAAAGIVYGLIFSGAIWLVSVVVALLIW